MHSTLRQRIGSGIAVFGVMVLATAGALSGTAPAGAEERTSPVCNNLHAGQDPTACASGGPYGDVDWDITGGQLVLHVTATEGIGWSDVRVCAPYGPPTNGADCQPNDEALLPTAAYTVEMKAPAGGAASSQDGKTYTFEPCGSEFVVRVPTSAIAGDPSDWWWAIHLAPGGGAGCGGTGTHEAFGHALTSATTTTTGQDTTTTTGQDTTTTTGQSTTTTTGQDTTTTTGQDTTTTTGQDTTTTTGESTTTTTGQDSTTTTAGNATTTTSPTTTTTIAVDGTTTSTDVAVIGVGIVAPAPEVLAERPVQDPVPAVQPQVIATLPVTGSRTSQLLALAGLALLLGGLAIRLGGLATER